jgi:integrase
MRKRRDYLFKRNGSQYWRVRFQMDGRSVEQSLKTTDRREAELAALPMIAEHKQRLLVRRPRFVTSRWYDYAPGREHIADGAILQKYPNAKRVLATDADDLFILDQNGSIIGREPNGGLQYSHPTRLKEPSFELFDRERAGAPLATKNGDDELLETYLRHANVTGYYEHEARAVWALYKRLTDSKPLKEADRDDGRKLVAHFEGEGLKSATIEKKIGWLNAAVNLAIREGKLKFNPFSAVVPKRNDRQRRLPLSDDDMEVIKRNLGKLSESEQLLFRVLASTGMRLSEAFEIDSEEKERGCRFVIVGKKTEQSLRRVPLPAAALPFLPKAIKGPLFASSDADPADAASKKLNRFLDDCGIVDPRKVVHSLRHRAQDRLRAAGCPEDIRWALLGHEEKTVAAGYGEGHPVPLLRKWIDKIGC